MHMAVSTEDWLRQHALFCNRYHARITPGTCMQNRELNLDGQCTGCGGLEEVASVLPQAEPVTIHEDPAPERDPMSQALAGALQEILDGDEDICILEEEPEDLQISEPEELNDFHLQMLALLEDDEDDAPREKRRGKKKQRRFAVPLGRCRRCNGYLVIAPESTCGEYDDDAYRCFSCGHRTSPGYEWNRNRCTVSNYQQ